MLNYRGRMRLFYNKDGPDGLYWCVGHPSRRWEVAVPEIICTKPISSRFEKKKTPDDEDVLASAWFEVEGKLAVEDDGIARIY